MFTNRPTESDNDGAGSLRDSDTPPGAQNAPSAANRRYGGSVDSRDGSESLVIDASAVPLPDAQFREVCTRTIARLRADGLPVRLDFGTSENDAAAARDSGHLHAARDECARVITPSGMAWRVSLAVAHTPPVPREAAVADGRRIQRTHREECPRRSEADATPSGRRVDELATAFATIIAILGGLVLMRQSIHPNDHPEVPATRQLPERWRSIIRDALAEPSQWNVKRLAGACGCSRRTLERAFRRVGLPGPAAMLRGRETASSSIVDRGQLRHDGPIGVEARPASTIRK